MKNLNKIIEIGAVCFLISSLIDSLIWPNQFDFLLDNLFFPLGLLYSARLVLENKGLRIIAIVFGSLILWECIVSFGIYKQINTDTLLYLMRVMKLPVVFITIFSLLKPVISNKYVGFLPEVLFYLLAFINLILMLDPFGTGAQMQLLYATKYADWFSYYNEPGYFRLSGTFMNPNDNAMIFGLFLLYFINKGYKDHWIEILLSFGLLVSTQARTAVLGLVVILVIDFIIKVFKSGRVNWKVPALVLAFILVAVMITKPHNLYSLLNGDAFHSYSWGIRVQNLLGFFDQNIKTLIVGMGSVIDVKATFGVYLDSEYSAVLYQYGIIGMCFWFFIWIGINRICRNTTFLILTTFFLLILSITNYTLHNSSTAVFIFFLIPYLCLNNDSQLISPTINKPANK